MALSAPGFEFLMLVVTMSVAALSAASLLRARRARDEAIRTPNTSMRVLGRRYALQSFLGRRGRRVMWHLLIVSTFLACICVASLVQYYS
jgi:hypothetical protein